MTNWQYKIEMYDYLAKTKGELLEKAKKIPSEIGLPDKYRGQIGLTGTISECHGLLRKRVSDAVEKGARKVINNAALDFEVRKLVKSYYGDEYDAVSASTCEALLNIAFDTMATPPIAGRGDNYRARYIAPLERHIHHQGGYGRPFPPKYKDIFADRGVTAGEYGQIGKRLNNLDTVLVPLAGARYDCHGINYHPCHLMLDVDAEASLERLAFEADRHSDTLTAFSSLGYALPGYGHSQKADNGASLIEVGIADLAKRYNVPYILDNAAGLPFNCTDIRDVGADVMAFSMDKSAGAPTCGLAIGTEESISVMLRGLGAQGPRAGGLMSHGKAAYVTMDPGKEALIGLIATLEVLLERGDEFKAATDLWYEVTVDEFSRLDSGIRQGLTISKDYNSCAVEVNYERTWNGSEMGIPIFSIEDMYSGTSMIQAALPMAGVIGCIAYDGNVRMSPGLGTLDEDGQLMEEPARYAVRTLVRFIELMCEHTGVLDQNVPAVAAE
jgi:hypothetical protein